MASLQQGRGALAIYAAVAIAAALGYFGFQRWNDAQDATVATPDAARTAGQLAAGRDVAQPMGQAQPAPAPTPTSLPTPATDAPLVPSFDVVRVEPNGESVIAGRGAPGATIEMLRDGQVHARAAADQAGLFAFVPPALPPGSHQVTLQSIAPDGTRQRSKESVTIIVGEGRNTRPLVAITAPDKPTVLLSNPEVPEPKVAEAPAQPAAPAQQQASARPPAAPAPPAPAPAQGRLDVAIVAVDAEQGGRLFVSGQGTPGASVRLYLNDTFIAPGNVGGDGKVSFAIGRGVRPGDYQVRIDDVDPVTGSVKSRAEVAFNVPSPSERQTTSVASAAPAAPRAPGAVPEPSSTAAAPQSATATPTAPSTGPAAALNPQVASQVASAGSDAALRSGTILIPDVNTAIVSRGDNLWRISQRIYGSGYRYTVIYGANQKQIRNPDLIYPGQVFVLPADAPKAP
jgi:nucleoid-associated protein YgaU